MGAQPSGRRCIGLDVHREFAQVAVWQAGAVTQAGRIATTAEQLRAFAETLAPVDEVALEATGNTWAIATLLAGLARSPGLACPAGGPTRPHADETPAGVLRASKLLRRRPVSPQRWCPGNRGSSVRRTGQAQFVTLRW
jgi:transposase